MTWSRFEPGFTQHPKRMKCGPLASWLWVCSVDHCTKYRTDGFVAAHSVPGLCPNVRRKGLVRATFRLVESRSWEPVYHPDSGSLEGYIVHGYLEHNKTGAEVEADRAASRKRYRNWLNKNRGTDPPEDAAEADANAVANAFLTPLQTRSRHRDKRVHNASIGRSVNTKEEVSGSSLRESGPPPPARRTGAPAGHDNERGNGQPSKADALRALATLTGKTPDELAAETAALREAEAKTTTPPTPPPSEASW